MEESNSPSWNWNRPQNVINIRKQKHKKRALQDRLSLESESPTKKPRRRVTKFQAQPPPPDDQTNEDSTLMELLCWNKPTPPNLNPSHSSHSLSSNSSTSFYNLPKETELLGSPTRTYLSTYASPEQTPTPVKKRRQLIPTPVSTSPSKSSAFARRHKESSSSTAATASKSGDKDDEDYWYEELCQDWSMKTGMRIVACKPYDWTSNYLKFLEQASGTTAFVRCIDRDPTSSNLSAAPSSYQLDGLQSIGAQFNQCCLYWQFPYLYETSLFPRTGVTSTSSFNNYNGQPSNESSTNIRFGDRRSDQMHLEWIESFTSAFQLIRARQCPYFYMSTNQYTCLFTAAGMQNNDDIQVSITPSTKGFREVLQNEGIEFSMPYLDPEDIESKLNCNRKNSSSVAEDKSKKTTGNGNIQENSKEDKEADDGDESDEETWLDELGVSQSLSFSSNKSKAAVAAKSAKEKSKASLLVIVGLKDTLSFFNFLLNSKKQVVSTSGYLSGVPPTILAPVAFVGATLRSLKMKISKALDGRGGTIHSIDIHGPIMPHAVHMFSTLLVKTVEDFKIHMTTMAGSTLLNFLQRKEKPKDKTRPSAFHLQSLTDCGLGKNILEIFCRDDNVDSVKTALECKTGLFQWS